MSNILDLTLRDIKNENYECNGDCDNCVFDYEWRYDHIIDSVCLADILNNQLWNVEDE